MYNPLLRAATKLSCLFGNHNYSPVMTKFTPVDRFDNMGVYRVENDCIYCGKHYCTLVQIPFPVWMAGGDGDDKT